MERNFLGEIIRIISIFSTVVTWESPILSADKLSAVCLSLVSFDRNPSWSLYTYFLDSEDPAPYFVASFCFLHDFTYQSRIFITSLPKNGK